MKTAHLVLFIILNLSLSVFSAPEPVDRVWALFLKRQEKLRQSTKTCHILSVKKTPIPEWECDLVCFQDQEDQKGHCKGNACYCEIDRDFYN